MTVGINIDLAQALKAISGDYSPDAIMEAIQVIAPDYAGVYLHALIVPLILALALAVAGLVVAIVAYLFFRKAKSQLGETEWFYTRSFEPKIAYSCCMSGKVFFTAAIMSTFFFVIGVFYFIDSLQAIIGWMYAPEVMVLNEVLPLLPNQ